MNNRHHLILGGARSGKSRYAQQLAISSGLDVTYVATAQAGDAEMQARIQQHKLDRPQHWRSIEEPLKLTETLAAVAADKHCLLVDCLTLWMSNLMHEQSLSVEREVQPLSVEREIPTLSVEREIQHLLEQLQKLPGQILLVSNEVGLGITPMNPLARKFIDEVGLLHQRLAQVCGQVVFMTAGLPHYLKGHQNNAGSTE